MKQEIVNIVTVTGFLGLINGIQRFLLPIALVSNGWDLKSYGTIYFIQAFAMSLPLLFGGVSTDLKGRRLTIIISFFSFALGSLYFSVVISGTSLILLIIAQVVTTISVGISRMGLSIQIADKTIEGQQRTNSLGIQAGVRNTMGFVGPLGFGWIMDNYLSDLPRIDEFQFGFIFLGILGFIGIFLALRLPQSNPEFLQQNKETSLFEIQGAERQMQMAFGIEEIIIGFTSGMIVPFINYYIITEFEPSNTTWGILVALGNIGIALGSFVGGRYSENVGKVKTILGLYVAVPIMAAGIAFGPTLNVVGLFYVLRITTANLIQPVWESWYYTHALESARGRLMSLIQLSRRLSRSMGSYLGSSLLLSYGPIVFPLGCLFYPIAMAIPAVMEYMQTTSK